MRHELKTWPVFFKAILDGRKPFELRKNDRGFKRGDELLLREWELDAYTGREILARVEYVMPWAPGIMLGYVAMTIETVWTCDQKEEIRP